MASDALQIVYQIIQTGETAMYTNEQLEQALAQSVVLFHGRTEGKGREQKFVSAPASVIEQVRQARLLIGMMLRGRQREQATPAIDAFNQLMQTAPDVPGGYKVPVPVPPTKPTPPSMAMPEPKPLPVHDVVF